MSHTAFRLLVVWLCLVGVGSAAAQPVPPADFPPLDLDNLPAQVEHDRRLAAVATGLTPGQVRRLIGAPQHVAREVLYHRCVEQWVYDSLFQVRLEFDCPRGQEARLQSVQPPVVPGR